MTLIKSITKLPDWLLVFVLSAVIYSGVYWSRVVPHPSQLSFDRYIFADLCAFLNASVSVLLVSGRVLIHKKRIALHGFFMAAAFILSFLFLLSYFAHHALAGETVFPKNESGRTIYLLLLFSHVIAAAITLPLIIMTVLAAIRNDRLRHKRIARITFPIWLYVSVTGVAVYFMIQSFYPR